MDNIGCWNISSLNEPSKQLAVKTLIKDDNISLISILETRVREPNKMEVLSVFGHWKCLDNYSSVDGARIWVMWDPRKLSVKLFRYY